MAINDSFRFWFDLPGNGLTQVYPYNSQLKWTDKRKSGYPRLIQRTLETPLTMMDEPAENNYGFTYLMDLERQGLTCERVDVIIDRYCDCNETWTEEWYKGYLRLNAGEWDVSSCRVDIPVVVNDLFACLTNTWTEDVNMYDYGDPTVQISPFLGVIQKEECFCNTNIYVPNSTPQDSVFDFIVNAGIYLLCDEECPDIAAELASYAKIEHCMWATPPFFGHGQSYPVHLKTTWAREFVAGGTQPDGLGWIAVVGGWARPVPTYDGPYYFQSSTFAQSEEWEALMAGEGFENPTPDFDQYFYIGFHKTWHIVGFDANGNATFENGKQLGPLLEALLAPCEITVISNFYNINPDGTAPVNDYYTRAAEDFAELILYQISDIARIDETEAATIALMKLKELIDAMKVMGNCDIGLDGSTLRIEHESYWPDEVQMDLTLPEFYHLIKEKWKYTYDQESQPKNEIIAWGSETDGKGNDFDGYPIEYDNTCVNDQEDKSDKTYQAENYLSNILKIIGNEDYYDDTETLVIISTKNLVINSALQPISGLVKLNGNLAMGYLLPRYYDYARPFKEGFINKTLTLFYRSLRLRLQAPITIPMQCDDYMNNYDPAKLIKTQLGACQIHEGTYTDPDETLEVKLRAK